MCISITLVLLKAIFFGKTILKASDILYFLYPSYKKLKCHLAFIVVNSDDFIMAKLGDRAGSSEPRQLNGSPQTLASVIKVYVLLLPSSTHTPFKGGHWRSSFRGWEGARAHLGEPGSLAHIHQSLSCLLTAPLSAGSPSPHVFGDSCRLPGHAQSCRCPAWHSLLVEVASWSIHSLFLLESPDLGL